MHILNFLYSYQFILLKGTNLIKKVEQNKFEKEKDYKGIIQTTNKQKLGASPKRKKLICCDLNTCNYMY